MTQYLQDNLNLSISRGLIPNVTPIAKFGRNQDVDIGTEDIWGNGGTFVPPTTAGVVNFASSSAADAAAGTGARTMSVQGLDGNYNQVSETITLNGTNNVATSNSYFIINRCIVLTAGSGGTNAGTITGTSTGSGTPAMITVVIGKAQSQFCIYQVPAGYSAYLMGFGGSYNGGATSNVVLELFAKPFGGVYNLKGALALAEAGSTGGHRDYVDPLVFTEKTTIKLTATSDTANSDVIGNFDLIIIAN